MQRRWTLVVRRGARNNKHVIDNPNPSEFVFAPNSQLRSSRQTTFSEMKRIQDIDVQILVTDAQIEAVRKKEGELHRLEHEISKLRRAATVERKQLEELRVDLEAQKLPINWVPPEVLLEVFTFLCCSKDTRIPTDFPAITLSHVCSKWRKLVLSTSDIWSTVWFPCSGWSRQRVLAYLDRSGKAPLDVVFGSKDNAQCRTATRRVVTALSTLANDYHRIRSCTLECQSLDPAYCIVETLNFPPDAFPQLTSIDMAVTRERFSYASFPFAERDESQREPFSSITPSILRRLSLGQIPLLSLPVHFFILLQALEFSIPECNPRIDTPIYASHFLTRLYYSRHLRELRFSNVTFSLDVETFPEGEWVRRTKRPGVLEVPILPVLKTLSWSFPPARQIPQFLSLWSLPALEQLDLSFDEDKATSDRDPNQTQRFTPHPRLHYPKLRELYLESRSPESISAALRSITFPSLTKLDMVNLSMREDERRSRNKQVPGATTRLLPRFETIFHEPHMLRLTHLSLSFFDIADPSQSYWSVSGADILGYIPALELLSLEGCQGVEVLIKALAQRTPPVTSRFVGSKTSSTSTRRRPRFCPQLQSLSFSECFLDFQALQELVKTRNDSDENEEAAASEDISPVEFTPPDDSLSGQQQYIGSPDSTSIRAEDVPEGSRRVIKPLPSTRSRGSRFSQKQKQSDSLAARMVEMTLELEPARIGYMRFDDCHGIFPLEAYSFEELGVDVVWNYRDVEPLEREQAVEEGDDNGGGDTPPPQI
ncbi:hypothetical protein D9758_012762 [Tetrapyrgos nigripes]|uniref:F-box domain-containing protein n=1 Tax=Tetrapyrgos nigripes TaxID=182062 RepID=A0A8H5CST9_9AGAR|nr:hypothetical protein D9758_012762 [Tetrapyrgos nigripes]